MNIKSILAGITLSTILAATAPAQIIYYQDSFNRTGPLLGTAPDVVNTNGNLWQSQAGGFETPSYSTAGGSASFSGNFGSIYLPVNGGSGVILNGTQDFVLSVQIVSVGTPIGIALDTAPIIGNNGDQFITGAGHPSTILASLGTYGFGSTNALYGNSYIAQTPGGGPSSGTLAISYDASAETLTYSVNNVSIGVATGVTAAQIASLNYVSINNGSFGPSAGTFDNFTLTVVPEPTTVGLAVASLGLMLVRQRRRKS